LSSNRTPASETPLDPEKLPRHVAIIMDGNGRWAKKRLLNRIKGHEQGAETVRTIVRTSRELGIGFLTLYAFSTENWQRPKTEIAALMELLDRFLISERKELTDNNIRLQTIGQIERMPATVRKTLQATMEMTKDNDGMLLSLALSYGARDEIVRMVQTIARDVIDGRIELSAITPEVVSRHLDTRGMPDPDLLIRTSGEMRISNFLLWQIAYTEICVTDILWPEFTKAEYIRILQDFLHRERRFGKV